MVRIIHKVCGRTAFYYDGELKGRIASHKATLCDGSKPVAGEPILCGSCGKVILLAGRELRPDPDDTSGPNKGTGVTHRK